MSSISSSSSVHILEQQLQAIICGLANKTTAIDTHWRARIDQYIEQRKAEKLAELEAILEHQPQHQQQQQQLMMFAEDNKENIFLREILQPNKKHTLADIFSNSKIEQQNEKDNDDQDCLIPSQVLLAEMSKGLQAKFGQQQKEKKLSTSSDASGSSSGFGTATAFGGPTPSPPKSEDF